MAYLKRIIFCLLLAGGLGFIVRGPRPNAELPKDRLVVDYWEKWVGNEAAQMQSIVDDFNDTVGKDKGIFVHYLSMSGIEQKTLVSIAGGVPPDIAGLWDVQVAQYAALDALEPLDELAREAGITEQTYEPVYWNGCHYDGHLWALVSSPAAVALHYDKEQFREAAASLRAAGCDPDRPPRTIDELDRYAAALDRRDASGQIVRAGYVPLQSWYVAQTVYWFGGRIYDPAARRFTLTSPQFLRAFGWVRSYTARLGQRPMQDFSNGLGNFDSPQNPFLVGRLVMQQQGPWMANYIENLKPSMNRWHEGGAGAGSPVSPDRRERERALARKLEAEYRMSAEERRSHYQWAVAPFPSDDPALKLVSYCPFDVLMIPKGARHRKEAFAFMAYVQRQDVTEKLNRLHCDNSPLRKVSDDFLDHHPNPYIRVFQELAASPNARGVPPVPIWPEVVKELSDAATAVAMDEAPVEPTLRRAQERLQEKLDRFERIEAARSRQGRGG